ncbi:hypothetical protein CTAYLR_007792 [Chrysophaeum taylorii]|uniref:Coronin n=1 Tax=Chrysophaeum taylorii TaxID=2483200 RepID=A0AAD7UJ16_9STRA|nr:hypothetical protein CTAYLR_007792 [Chrysophaeum taylorii]
MSGFVRASKYRHVYVEAPKVEDTYKGFRLSTATGEQQYIKGNTKFFAVALQGGGGPIAVVPFEHKGSYAPSTPIIAGHKGQVLDFDFNPFHEHLIASASEDLTIKVWGIPPDGLTETITEPLVDLHGHGRKVTLLRFHPTANNVLGSIGGDFVVKVWDIEKGSEIGSMDIHDQLIQDLVWDYEGKIWGTTCKDKRVRLGDPRANAVVGEIPEAHQGAKSSKLAFLGETGRFVTLGFTKQSQRQLKIWDVRDLTKSLTKVDIDQAAGVILPFFDPDTKVLYLCGKGDGNIRYYECVDGKPFVFSLSEYRSTQAAKGACFLPKRGLNIMKCETARCLKLTSQAGQGVVEPLAFIVPRKSDAFQDDIFPDTFSGLHSLTADEWLAGNDAPPNLVSLNPDAKGGAAVVKPRANPAAKFTPVKTTMQLQKELDDAHKLIDKLTTRLKEAGLPTS